MANSLPMKSVNLDGVHFGENGRDWRYRIVGTDWEGCFPV